MNQALRRWAFDRQSVPSLAGLFGVMGLNRPDRPHDRENGVAVWFRDICGVGLLIFRIG